jgi:acyl carrier protein
MRQFLAQQLPEYMLPSHFVPLEAFPLLPNGKVNRKILPKPTGLYPVQERSFVAPQSALEQRIAEVWKEALQLDRVGVYDNFFDLGGHSLLMIRLHSKLSEVIRADLSLMDLFRFPTISSLAEYLAWEEPAAPSFEKIEERSQRQREAKQQRQRMRRRSE